MIRFVITAVLFISVFFMMQAISSSWRQKMPTVPLKVERKEAQAQGKVPARLEVQPAVPSVLPDLKAGYLFNEERLIENEASKVLDEEGVLVNDLGIDASIEELTYSGSIIGDTFSRAIISYPEKKKRRATGRARGKSGGGGMETAQLTEGDVLNGYKVTSILAEKIIFTKGEDVLEKFLYDPSKKRAAPTRQAVAPARGTALAAPAPAGSAPGSITTSAAPAETPSAAPVAAAPRTVPTRRVAAPQPATSRRVLSRTPPPRPDTSRVSRRRRTSDGPAISTPPMPHLGN